MSDLLVPTADGLRCEAGDFHVDPWRPVRRALVTHGHADHARPGSAEYWCAAPSEAVLRHRLGEQAVIRAMPYGESRPLGRCGVSFHPAGHVLGSAQLRVESAGEVWVVSGDYKRDADPTCAPFETVRCDVFVTEATFGLPIYRWDEPATVLDAIAAWCDDNARHGVTSVVLAYALGKAQRVIHGLAARTAAPIFTHGAVEAMNTVYRAAGVPLPATRSVVETDRAALAGAIVVAPPAAFGSPWMRRFSRSDVAFASGWMLVRGMRRRRAVDRGFALSDHADWPALLRTIAESGARRVLVTHGASDALARHLREHDVDAQAIVTEWVGESDAE